jgi:hypothetical protein
MTGFHRCASAEDSAVLARRHDTLRTRSALFDVPKLMSSLDICYAVHDGIGDYTFLRASCAPMVWESLDHSA